MSLLDAWDSRAILGWQYWVKGDYAHQRYFTEHHHTAMKIKLSFSAPAIVCLALASCYPIDSGPRESRGPRTNPDETVTSQDQQKIQEQREELKKKAEKKEELAEAPKEKTPTTPDKPTQKKGDYAFANRVPGKDGFVFSPYNNKLVDVRDIPSGTLVQDPTYPASEKKYFRVP